MQSVVPQLSLPSLVLTWFQLVSCNEVHRFKRKMHWYWICVWYQLGYLERKSWCIYKMIDRLTEKDNVLVAAKHDNIVRWEREIILQYLSTMMIHLIRSLFLVSLQATAGWQKIQSTLIGFFQQLSATSCGLHLYIHLLFWCQTLC